MIEAVKHIEKPENWVDNYSDYLFSFAISRVSDREMSKDLVQETFLSALKAYDKFKGNSSVKTWLVSILNRKIIDYYRKNSKKIEYNTLDSDSPFVKDKFLHGAWEKERQPLDWGMGDEDLSGNDDFIKVLRYCISLLPENLRGVFLEKSLGEESTQEICKEFDISASNLWVIIHRARLRLRECIENGWFNK